MEEIRIDQEGQCIITSCNIGERLTFLIEGVSPSKRFLTRLKQAFCVLVNYNPIARPIIITNNQFNMDSGISITAKEN